MFKLFRKNNGFYYNRYRMIWCETAHFPQCPLFPAAANDIFFAQLKHQLLNEISATTLRAILLPWKTPTLATQSPGLQQLRFPLLTSHSFKKKKNVDILSVTKLIALEHESVNVCCTEPNHYNHRSYSNQGREKSHGINNIPKCVNDICLVQIIKECRLYNGSLSKSKYSWGRRQESTTCMRNMRTKSMKSTRFMAASQSFPRVHVKGHMVQMHSATLLSFCFDVQQWHGWDVKAEGNLHNGV